MKSTCAILIFAIVIATASAFGVYTPVNVSQRVSGLLGFKEWFKESVFLNGGTGHELIGFMSWLDSLDDWIHCSKLLLLVLVDGDVDVDDKDVVVDWVMIWFHFVSFSNKLSILCSFFFLFASLALDNKINNDDDETCTHIHTNKQPIALDFKTIINNNQTTAPRNGASSMVMRARVCDLLGKKPNRQARVVTFSHTRNKKVQHVNLQTKKYFSEDLGRNIKLRLSTKGMKTVEKYGGVDAAAKKFGLDLNNF